MSWGTHAAFRVSQFLIWLDVLFHQLGQGFVLPSQLGLELFSPSGLAVTLRPPPLALKCRCSVFEELLLSAVEDHRLEMLLVADRRYVHLLDPVPFQDDDLFLRAMVFAVCGAQASLRLESCYPKTGKTAFPTEAGHLIQLVSCYIPYLHRMTQ
jgi:hypothetical protein